MIQGALLAGSEHGGQYAGGGATIRDGVQAAGTSSEGGPSVATRGMGYGGRVGATYATPAAGNWGGTYGVSKPSVQSLLDVDGFAVVLERGDGRRRAYQVDEPRQSIIDLSITIEVNTKSDWRVTMPADPDLYEWSFSRAVIGHNGERLFHGIMLPVEADRGDPMTIGGFGPLWHATHGDLSVTYPDDHPDYSVGEDIPAWRAINHAWERVGALTDNQVRGYAFQPPDGHERVIPGSGETFEGTPLAVIQRIHSYSGMAFSIDHSDPAGIAVSFIPGAETRAAQWTSTDYSVDIDPADYANRVVVKGANAPDAYTYDRFRGVAEAPQAEIDTVTNGDIIEHVMDAPDLSSERACEQQAESKLAELRGNYSITGSVDATPVPVTPGYQYRIEEFDAAAPEAFTPVEMPLQNVEHSIGLEDASTTLSFETTEGVVRAIRERLLGEGTSIAVARQSADFAAELDITGWGRNWGQNWGE